MTIFLKSFFFGKQKVPCSLLCVLLRGQLASTSSATQVRLFLPCRRKVQSRRDCSKALLVSSPTSLQGGILGIQPIFSILTTVLLLFITVYHYKNKNWACNSVCITLVTVWHDCCHLPPLELPQLTSPCLKAAQKRSRKQTVFSTVKEYTCRWLKLPEFLTNLCSEANKRHVSVTHGYKMSQLFVKSTHFSRSLRLLWLRVTLLSRNLQSKIK